jgi:hypothetical protein
MENWRSNLNTLLRQHGYFTLTKWNEQLLTLIKKWAEQVSETDGINAQCSIEVEEFQKTYAVKVNFNGSPYNEFVCRMFYDINEDGIISLYVKTVKRFRLMDFILKSSNEEKSSFYEWQLDEHNGIEVFEEAYVLETLTIMFANYLKKNKNNS